MKHSLRFEASCRASIAFAALAALAALPACAHRDTTAARAPEPMTLTSTQVPVERAPAATMGTTPAESDARATGEAAFKTEVGETTPMNDSVAIDAWAKRYPDASSELNDWMGHYPSAARKLAAWDAAHPTRMKTLTDWAITHRYEAVGAFLYGRSGWDEFLDIAQSEPDGVQEFLGWARRSSPAAVELTSHLDSLAWAGKNLKARAGHVPMPAKSVAAPAPVVPAAVPGRRGSGGATPPADAGTWFPSPTSMIR
jgi:hypothetical protein